MRNKTLYSAIFDGEYPFGPLFKEVTTITSPSEMTEKDAVLILWGGGDISPSLYGHGVSRATGAGHDPSNRDMVEYGLANKAVELGIPVIGICRGAQLMCAVSGGYLIQDVTGHTRSHQMEDIETKEVMTTSSLHHQMMFPWGVAHQIIARALPAISEHYIAHPESSATDINIEAIPCEPEIIWFPKTKSLCIQGHPEFMGVTTRYVEYCFELVKKWLPHNQ